MKTYTSLGQLTPAQLSGAEQIDGNLNLSYLSSLPSGVNLDVTGWLNLNSVTDLPSGVSLTAGRDLYLRSVTDLPSGVSLTAGGDLYLSSVTSLPSGVSLTAGGSLYLRSVTSLQSGVSLTAGKDLYLRSLPSLPSGVSLMAGGSLHLNSVTDLPSGVSLTAGGDLRLRSVTDLPADISLTAGGCLYLSSGTRTDLPKPTLPLVWNNHILADGVLARIVSRRQNVYRVVLVGKTQQSYLVTNGTEWAHGSTLSEARADLVYKTTDRNPDQYRDLPLSHKFSFQEAVACYRTITGACREGVRYFVETNGIKRTSVTIRQMLEKTEGQYGSERFREFFVTK